MTTVHRISVPRLPCNTTSEEAHKCIRLSVEEHIAQTLLTCTLETRTMSKPRRVALWWWCLRLPRAAVDDLRPGSRSPNPWQHRKLRRDLTARPVPVRLGVFTINIHFFALAVGAKLVLLSSHISNALGPWRLRPSPLSLPPGHIRSRLSLPRRSLASPNSCNP